MDSFVFKSTPEFKEALHAGACYARTSVSSLSDFQKVMTDGASELVLSNRQVSAILSGLEAAIQAQMSDYGDWERAQSYAEARNYLIAETRKQFKII
jgi:hypothetical protein